MAMKAANDDLLFNTTNWLTKGRFADKYLCIGVLVRLFFARFCMEHLDAFEQSFACRDDKCVTAVDGNGTNMILPRLSVRQPRALSIA